jgi:hypothetical protein
MSNILYTAFFLIGAAIQLYFIINSYRLRKGGTPLRHESFCIVLFSAFMVMNIFFAVQVWL